MVPVGGVSPETLFYSMMTSYQAVAKWTKGRHLTQWQPTESWLEDQILTPRKLKIKMRQRKKQMKHHDV